MQLVVKKASLEESETPLMVLGFTEENISLPPEHLSRAVDKLVILGDFKGEKGTSGLIYPENAEIPRLLLVGLGKESELETETVRRVAGSFSRVVQNTGVKHSGIYRILRNCENQ